MTVETTLYTTRIGDDEPIEELPANIIRYGYRLNAPGAIDFALSVSSDKCRDDVVAAGRHEGVVERNGRVVWRGPILGAKETANEVRFRGEGLLAHPRRMHITSDIAFAGVDQFTIARSLIDHHQAKTGGDFGIDTTGGTTSGVHRDRTYYGFTRKNVYEALTELAAVRDGFDIAIDPATRRLELHYPRQGRRRTDIVIDARTIRHFDRTIDATVQASQVLGIGAGEGDDMVAADRQDMAARDEYGLTQAIYSNKDVSNPATLVAHVERELETLRDPVEVISLTVGADEPPAFSYGVGDDVTVKHESAYRAVAGVFRIVGRDITWQNGEERVELIVTKL